MHGLVDGMGSDRAALANWRVGVFVVRVVDRFVMNGSRSIHGAVVVASA